jgi:hypothetical protein
MARDLSKLNILVSYVYMTNRLCGLLLKNQKDIRLLIDSGAFTAWKAGKRIRLNDYMNFLKKLPIKPWRYFTLDVIGDGEKTWDNYQRMLDEGFKPIPIFTRGEDFAMLDKYYETSDLVAVGGLVGTPGNKGYVKRIMQEIGDRKVHWLGFTHIKYIRYYQPYSVDSSQHCASVQFVPTLMRHVGLGQIRQMGRSPLPVQRTLVINGRACIGAMNAVRQNYKTKKFIVTLGPEFCNCLLEAYYENGSNLLGRT